MSDAPPPGEHDVPAPLRFLTARLTKLTDALTHDLATGVSTVTGWQESMSQLLARYGQAALLTGLEADVLDDRASAAARTYLSKQLQFLARFAIEIQEKKEWQAGWNARAQLYAESIGEPYWTGATKLLPLPAMPRDGTTQCLVRCRCRWQITPLDGEENYDCYWRMGSAEHCQTCRIRAREWAPLRIRAGRLVAE